MLNCDHNNDKLVTAKIGDVGWGGNSGFQVLNMLVQAGCNPIVLVGYDMRLDKGMHWHPDHPRGMNNPTPRNVERWRRVTDETSLVLSALGIKVYNTSPASALRNFPKMSLTEALARGA